MILFEKFGQHQPLNRQADRYAREGVELSLSTLADQVGACTAALGPIHALIKAHVLSAERLHGDDTTVPLLAKGGTKTARLWTYVRDDRPFVGGAPPAALFHFSRDREKTHPNEHLKGWKGVLQADAYSGYNDLYRVDRKPGPVASALCWAHARRKFFVLADIAGKLRKGKPAHDISPIALDAVKRIDAIFDIEREINGLSDQERLEVRNRLSRPLVDSLHNWMLVERARMSKHADTAKAIAYMVDKDRWTAFTRFLDDGRICLTNNAAERALRRAPILEPPPDMCAAFEARFPYEETDDQLQAIDDVREGLRAGTPMDRLVVGDVGFGKTEVAMRAAFIAATSGKQVAVIAPTTPLARQHLDGGILRLVLNNPPANTLSDAMLDALADALENPGEDTRVIIIAANGHLFCAGHDLKEMRA